MKKQYRLTLLASVVISTATYATEQLEAINVTAELGVMRLYKILYSEI